MKNIGLIFGLLIGLNVHAVTVTAKDAGLLYERDMSTSALNGWASMATGLTGKSNVCVINGGTDPIKVAVGGSSCNASSVANFAVPASGGSACIEGVKISGAICVYNQGGLKSGKIYSWSW